MKSLTLTVGLFFVFANAFGQNIAINKTGASGHPSSILDIQADSLGVSFPHVNTVVRNSIPSPKLGLWIFNIDDSCYQYYKGAGIGWSGCMTERGLCPPGFARVPGRNYCIEVNERPLCEWDTANKICSQLGYRLCYFSEWREACFSQSDTEDNAGNPAPLQNMVGNNEWTVDVDSNGNGVVAGSGSCTNVSGISIYTVSPRFRCCYPLGSP